MALQDVPSAFSFSYCLYQLYQCFFLLHQIETLIEMLFQCYYYIITITIILLSLSFVVDLVVNNNFVRFESMNYMKYLNWATLKTSHAPTPIPVSAAGTENESTSLVLVKYVPILHNHSYIWQLLLNLCLHCSETGDRRASSRKT